MHREVNFAGFRITDTGVKPLEKFLVDIRDFPTPTKIIDIRSWFGLANQVGNYNQLSDMMLPFRPLLKAKSRFCWTEELDTTFRRSKLEIVRAIEKGVEIFDVNQKTSLRPDWSKTGVGFFLSPKHCSCKSPLPQCCQDGWKITLAGSRFLKPAETRYAPVEGEALAIAWSLEQTKYFTKGCQDLLVTDHKPLVKLFTDRMLDEISNPRLFSLRQWTLQWRFDVQYMPGKGNCFSDATSRHPVDFPENEISGVTATDVLERLRVIDEGYEDMDAAISHICSSTFD